MELEVEFIFIGIVLEFPALVLLVADDGLQPSSRQVQRVVPYGLVVMYLLEGQGSGVGLRGPVADEFSRSLVALAFDDAGRLVEQRSREVGVAPLSVQPEHHYSSPFLELRSGHVAVFFVLVGVGVFVREASVPDESLLVAGEVQRVVNKSVFRLIFCGEACLHLALGLYGTAVEDDHSGHGIAAIHERGRPLQYLYRIHVLRVYFYPVLVAPLLSFLPDALVHDDDAVVAQSANDGFRDAAARGDLRHSRLTGNGIDDVGGCRLPQLLSRDDGDGSRGVL